jgi:hypothetical protein
MAADPLQPIDHAPAHLRGLGYVPFGFLLVVVALQTWDWAPFASGWVVLGVGGAFLWAVVASKRWYDDRYGFVESTGPTAVHVVVIVAAVAVASVLNSAAPWSLDLPVNVVPLTFGLVLLGLYAFVVGPRAHNLAIWGALVAVSALPVWHMDRPITAGILLLGVATVVNGVLDHVALVRLADEPRSAG